MRIFDDDKIEWIWNDEYKTAGCNMGIIAMLKIINLGVYFLKSRSIINSHPDGMPGFIYCPTGMNEVNTDIDGLKESTRLAGVQGENDLLSIGEILKGASSNLGDKGNREVI